MKKTKLIFIAILCFAALVRLWGIAIFPALNADEAALGYNAYSLLLTGKDEHGNSWPIHFQSFNDFKPGFYVYLALPFIKVLGLTELAVRLPGVLLSIATIGVIYALVKEIFDDEKHALAAALFLAISPWHIHFSRGAWEVSVSTFLITTGLLFLLKGTKDARYFYLSAVTFVMALYTYHAARIVIPLLGIGFLIQQNIHLFKFKKQLSLVVIMGVFLLIPLGRDLFGAAGLSRAAGVGLFADPGPISRINEQRGEHEDFDSILAKLLHNKPVNYGLAFLDNWAAHYHGEFLFLSGDEIQRNRVPETGQMYLIDFFFVASAAIVIAKRPKRWGIIIWWLLVAPVAAALTFQSPHALRAHNMVIPLVIISSFGFVEVMKLLEKLSWKRLSYLIIVFVLALSVTRYLHMYYVHMAKEYPYSSQYGVKEMVLFVEKEQGRFNRVIITDRYDQPYILYLFYTKYPPEKFQKEHSLGPRDGYGFSTVREFDKVLFSPIRFDLIKIEYPNSLIIGTDEEIPDQANIIQKIYLPNGEKAFEIVAN